MNNNAQPLGAAATCSKCGRVFCATNWIGCPVCAPVIAASAEAFALQVAEQRIAELEAQLAEAQRERDALTHDIERHIAIASEYATENANDAYMRWKQGDGKRADGGELFDAMLEKRAAVEP